MIDINQINDFSRLERFESFLEKLNSNYDLKVERNSKLRKMIELLYNNKLLPFSETCNLMGIPRTTMHYYYEKLKLKNLIDVFLGGESSVKNKGRPPIIIAFKKEVRELM